MYHFPFIFRFFQFIFLFMLLFHVTFKPEQKVQDESPFQDNEFVELWANKNDAPKKPKFRTDSLDFIRYKY